MIRPTRIWTVDGRIVPKGATSVDVSLRVHNSTVLVESMLTLASMAVVQLFNWFT